MLMSLQNKAELLDFWVYQRKIRIKMPNNPYFSNIVPANGRGGRGGSMAGKIIGGIAQAHRAAINHEYAADLIKQRAVGEIVTNMATASIATDADKTDMENRRTHYKTLTDSIHSHLSPEERKAAGIGEIDPFLVGGKDFQQLGQSRVGRIKPGENPAGKGNANIEDAKSTWTPAGGDESSFTDTHDEGPTPPPPPGPTPDTFTDQTPAQAAAAKKTTRKKSAAKPKADKATSTPLSSKSVTQVLADSNKEDN